MGSAGVSGPVAVSLLALVAVVGFVGAYTAFAVTSAPTVAPTALVLAPEPDTAATMWSYRVLETTPDLLWRDVVVIVDGTPLDPALAERCPDPPAGTWLACFNESGRHPTDAVTQGTLLKVRASHGALLRIVDARTGHLAARDILR